VSMVLLSLQKFILMVPMINDVELQRCYSHVLYLILFTSHTTQFSDHMYRMSLMAMISSFSNGKIDTNRCIQLALIHDLAEAQVGDITPYCKFYYIVDDIVCSLFIHYTLMDSYLNFVNKRWSIK